MSRSLALARFVRELPSFLREPMSLAAAHRIIRRQLDERDANFLSFVERAVYARPSSPYLPLLSRAGCEFGDLEASVRGRGLEATLVQLRREGVYVSFEEFKGKEPIVRGDVVVHASAEDFDNPIVRRGYRTRSSGSTGTANPSWVSIDYLAGRVPSTALALHSSGVFGLPSAMWRESLPAPSIGLILEDSKVGQRYERWFAPPLARAPRAVVSSWIATELIVRAGGRAGVRLPRPEPVPYDRASDIVRWAEARLAERGACLIRAGVSNALRIAGAAREVGVDLTGVTLYGGGEPTTAAKVRAMEDAGARWMPGYATSEVGRIGTACMNPLDVTDLHYLKYAVALIAYPRRVPNSERTVDAFNFSSLHAGSPKVLLNAESDDYGILETRSCGCPVEDAGLTEHIRQVFSFRKLTGEGITLIGSETLRVLEDVLPRRFGGNPVDYQLVEEEDEAGYTRLVLVVSPRVALPDDRTVVDAFLQALGDSGLARDVRSIWDRAGSMSVRRAEPEVDLGGKVRPLVLGDER